MSVANDLMGRLQEVSDQEIYREIKGLDTWDGLLAQMDDSNLRKPTRRALIESWIRNRWDLLQDGLPKEAVESAGALVVHRCIGVKNPQTFVGFLHTGRGKGLGIYWSYSFATAECYWWSMEGVPVVLTGLVDLNAIDIPGTVFANFNPDFGEQESEIRLKKGAPVLLTSVSLDDNDPRWRFDPGLPLRT